MTSKDRYLVISTDCHAGLPPGGYREYLDPQYRERFDAALQLQRDMAEESRKTMLVEDINAEWRKGNEELLCGAWDHDTRIKVLDDDGIAGEVMFCDGITENNTPPFGAGIGLSPVGADRELQWAGARAHNRWIAEMCQMAPERRVGVAIVPATWDVDEAVREVRWCRENGLSSVMLPIIWGDHDPYHHPKYDALWSVCMELEVVVNFHSGAAEAQHYFGPNWPPRPGGEPPLLGGMGIYVCEAVWLVARPLTFLIWGGVFERFPQLRVVVTEGTASWVPHYLEHWDERYVDWHVTSKLGDYKSHLSMKPSDYYRRNVHTGSFLAPREMQRREQIGVNTLMWGSDYPHPEGSWPFTREQMIATFKGLPEDEIAAMLGGNAAEFYGFDTEKLAPIVARIGPEKSAFAA